MTGDIFCSVLQVLQSENVIRTLSLISQGFKMSEVKEISSSVSNSAKTESDADLLSERLNFQIKNIILFNGRINQ